MLILSERAGADETDSHFFFVSMGAETAISLTQDETEGVIWYNIAKPT